jgi:hypothetical protein
VVAAQTLDTVSIHLPPEKFMPVLLSHVQPALASEDPVQLRGNADFCPFKKEEIDQISKKESFMAFDILFQY